MAAAILAVVIVVVVIGGALVAGRLISARSRQLAAAEVVQRLAEPSEQRAELHAADALLGVAEQAASRLGALAADLAQGLSPGSLAPPSAGPADQLKPTVVMLTQLNDVAARLGSAQLPLAQPAETDSAPAGEALASVLRAARLPDTVVRAAVAIRVAHHEQTGAQAADNAADVLTRYLADERSAAAAGLRGVTRKPRAVPTAKRNVAPLESGRPGPSLSDQAKTLATLADTHGPEKRELLAVMTELGLDVESPGLREWTGYSTLLAGYEDVLRGLARELAERVTATMAGELAGSALADRSPAAAQLAESAPAPELTSCISDLATATERYGTAVSALLTSAGLPAAGTGGGPGAEAARQALAALPAALAQGRQQVADGDARAGLLTLSAAALPVAASWGPSQHYDSGCAAAARRLGDLAAAQCATAAQILTDQIADLQQRHNRIAAAVRGHVTAWVTRRDQLWTDLRDAAHRVQREAAQALVSQSARRDATAPIEAAAAMLGIQELTTAGLGHAVRTAIPVTGEVLESHTADPRRLRVERSIDAFDRGAVALAGLDGLLSPLLSASGPSSGTELAAAMRQLAPVPRDIHLALTDLATYLTHPATGLAVTKSAASAISYAREGVLPDLPHLATDTGFVHLLGDAVHMTSQLSGIAELLGPDGSLTHYGLEQLGGTMLGGVIKAAELSPLVQLSALHVNDAADHIGAAATHAAPALLHGVATHVPYVTLVLSVTREIRIQREYKTSLDDAVKSIALDVGGVSAGILTGELLAHLLALHAAIVTIPATILARLGTRQLRRHTLQKAQAAYATQAADYETKTAEIVSRLDSSLRSAIDRESAAYHSTIGRPEPLSLAAAAQLGTIVRSLQAATNAYAKRVQTLLSAERSLPGTGIHADSRAAALRALDAVPTAVARCDQQLEDGRPIEALMTIAGVRLPVTDAWSAGRAYRETWTETVARLRAVEEQYWRRVATWATDACAQFSASEQRLAELATASIASCKNELSACQVELDKAAKVVEVRSAQLHGRQKH